jgi:hypothetical protein
MGESKMTTNYIASIKSPNWEPALHLTDETHKKDVKYSVEADLLDSEIYQPVGSRVRRRTARQRKADAGIGEFVDPQVREVCRLLFAVFAVIAVAWYGLSMTIQPTAYGTSNETNLGGEQKNDPASGRITKAIKSKPRDIPPIPDQESPVAVSPNKSPLPPDVSTAAEEHKLTPQPVKKPEPEVQASVAQQNPQANEPMEETNPQDLAPNQDSPNSQASDKQIIAGKTAPHFVLESMDAIKQVAREHGARFLVTDGSLSLEIGKDLGNVSSLRTIGGEWHLLYADRMQRMPDTPEVQAAIAAAQRKYPQLNPRTARVYLSIPHALDQLIYEEQIGHMGDAFDVNATTVIRLSGRRCVVVRVLATPVQ